MRRGGLSFRRHIWITLGIIFVAGLIILKIVLAAVYTTEAKKGATEAEVIHSVYADRVSKQTDVDRLAKAGHFFLQDRDYFYAALTLKRASDLDANYRDAAYGWAYATFQINQENLTPETMNDIKTGISRAEKVDPYFEPMLRLKLLIAELENDQDTLKATQDRMTVLGLKN